MPKKEDFTPLPNYKPTTQKAPNKNGHFPYLYFPDGRQASGGAYAIYLGDVRFPVAPSKITTKIPNKNKTFDLINFGEVNTVMSPGLREFEFELLLPQVPYPFSVYPDGFQEALFYLVHLKNLKEEKLGFQFIISRVASNGKPIFNTNWTVTLEDYQVIEDTKNGIDHVAKVKLREYRPFSTKTVKIEAPANNNEIAIARTAAPRALSSDVFKHIMDDTTYVTEAGDSLWNLAKKTLGDGNRYEEIYNINQEIIDLKNSKTGDIKGTLHAGQMLKMPSVDTDKKYV